MIGAVADGSLSDACLMIFSADSFGNSGPISPLRSASRRSSERAKRDLTRISNTIRNGRRQLLQTIIDDELALPVQPDRREKSKQKLADDQHDRCKEHGQQFPGRTRRRCNGCQVEVILKCHKTTSLTFGYQSERGWCCATGRLRRPLRQKMLNQIPDELLM
jgi:hypothetical protein